MSNQWKSIEITLNIKGSVENRPLFLEYTSYDFDVNWRLSPAEYDAYESGFLGSFLYENHNDEICDLIIEKVEKEEREAELERQLSFLGSVA